MIFPISKKKIINGEIVQERKKSKIFDFSIKDEESNVMKS